MPGFGSFVRARLRWLSIVQIVALLFVQIAVAAHACPALAADPAQSLVACAAHGNAPADPTPAQLCKAHCVADDQALGAGSSVDAPAAPLLLAVLDWRAASAAVLAPADGGFDRLGGAAPPGSPPLYLRLRILRQ